MLTLLPSIFLLFRHCKFDVPTAPPPGGGHALVCDVLDFDTDAISPQRQTQRLGTGSHSKQGEPLSPRSHFLQTRRFSWRRAEEPEVARSADTVRRGLGAIEPEIAQAIGLPGQLLIYYVADGIS